MLPPKGLRKQPLGFSFLRHRTACGTCPCRNGRSPHNYCRHSITGVLYGILTGQIKKWPQQMLPALRDDGMKNIAAARIQCETGQEEKDA